MFGSASRNSYWRYIKKAFNAPHYTDLIVKFLTQYEKARKKDIREPLWDKLLNPFGFGSFFFFLLLFIFYLNGREREKMLKRTTDSVVGRKTPQTAKHP